MATPTTPDHDDIVDLAKSTLGGEVSFGVLEVWAAGYETGFAAALIKAPKQTKRSTPQPKIQKDPTRLDIYVSEREYYGPEGRLAA